jgi:hypothetical protein
MQKSGAHVLKQIVELMTLWVEKNPNDLQVHSFVNELYNFESNFSRNLYFEDVDLSVKYRL